MRFVTEGYYQVLDVPPDAGEDQIRRAYRQSRHQWQGDSTAVSSLYAPEEAEAIAAKIDEAFQILTDGERRRRYDRYLECSDRSPAVPRSPEAFYEQARPSGDSALAAWMGNPLSGSREDSSGSGAEDLSPAGNDLPRVVHLFGGSADSGSTEDAMELEEAGAAVLAEAVGAEGASPSLFGGSDVGGEDSQTSRSTTGGSRPWSREMARMRARSAVVFDPLNARELSAEELRAAEQELGISGPFLRRVREMKGIDIHSISERTKISVLYLKFIEEENFGDLPAAIYLRGFLQHLARLLELPEQKVVEGYMAAQQRRHRST